MRFLTTPLIALIASAFCACAPALPSHTVSEEDEVGKALARVIAVSEETKELARRTDAQVRASEKLLDEARVLAQRAESAEAACKESVRKVTELKKKKVIRRPRRPVTPIPPVKAPPKEPEQKWPEHSPSDAP